MSLQSIFPFICAALLVVAIGCGNNNVKVNGKITLDDGAPVVGANVIFISGITQGRGTTNADGIYSLSFEKKNDGIPPGSYQVLVAGAFFTPDNIKVEDIMDTGARPMIDLKYAETETSPLNSEVPNAEGYDFVVEPSDFYRRAKR